MQVHALETAAIKPEPFNQYVSAGVVSGVATVSIGNLDRVTVCVLELSTNLREEFTITPPFEHAY